MSDEPTIADLAMLVARLVRQVRQFDATNPLADKAMDYLRRKNLCSAILRDIMEDMK